MPQFIWDNPNNNRNVYLTFDDGPTPDITEFVLDELKMADAKATFFCVGKNVERYNKLYQKILDDGHAVGNHSYNHPNGWLNTTTDYIENIDRASKYIKSKLFRPPYGRIKPAQWSNLIQHYKIVMWDVLPGDFDYKLSPEKCLSHAINHIDSGSIIVLHDSVKARTNLKYVLPRLLNHLNESGFNLKAITNDIN